MKDRIQMVVVLIVAAAISAAMLGWVYNYTKPKVDMNRELKLKRTVLDAFGTSYEEATVLETFDNYIEIHSTGGVSYYRSFIEERPGQKTYTGIAVELFGPGFWSPIKIIVALDQDLETIIGFKVVEQAETPGLGGRILELWFQEQFIGKKVKPALHLVINRRGDSPNEVDAITGATETSKALDRIINSGMSRFFERLSQGGNGSSGS